MRHIRMTIGRVVKDATCINWEEFHSLHNERLLAIFLFLSLLNVTAHPTLTEIMTTFESVGYLGGYTSVKQSATLCACRCYHGTSEA